jgi:hypothetical protein
MNLASVTLLTRAHNTRPKAPRNTTMKTNPALTTLLFSLALAAALGASTLSSRAQGATATISGVASGGGYNYTITLTDTGSTVLNSFWYGWTAVGNNLPSFPSTAGNTIGWANNLSGNSIEWVNSTGTTLTPGHSGVFTFFSTSTPAQITTAPAGGSVAYVNGIDFSQGLAGSSTPAFYPALVVPEPSLGGLLMTGLLGLAATGRRKLRG